MGAFGEKLRKQREQRGLELDAISNTTKISTRMLRALEDEHFDQLPGGVFNKGFVRAYARQVGLDEEEVVADYLTALRESQILQQSILPDFRAQAGKLPPIADDPSRYKLPANRHDDGHNHNHELRTESRRKLGRRNEDRRNEDRRNRNEDRRDQDLHPQHQSKDFSPRPASATRAPAANLPAQRFRQKYPAGNPGEPAVQSSTPIPWGKLALALMLVTLALAFWNFRRQDEPTPAANTVASSNQTPAPGSGPAPTSSPASAVTRSAGPASSPRVEPPVGTPATSSVATMPPPNSPPPTRSASTAPAPSANPPSPTASATGSTSKPAAPPPQPGAKPARATVHVAAPKPPPTFTVQIRAEQTTWVSLVADGKPVARETLIAPAHTSVRARHEIIVKTGNAAGLSFLLNGKEVPAQGTGGEVKTYVFDAPGGHPVPPTQLPANNQ